MLGLCTTEFYLILDVGVGGTNGWFPDGKEKPWYDGAQSMFHFLTISPTQNVTTNLSNSCYGPVLEGPSLMAAHLASRPRGAIHGRVRLSFIPTFFLPMAE